MTRELGSRCLPAGTLGLAVALVGLAVAAVPGSAQQSSEPRPARALGVVLASSLNVRAAPTLGADVRASVPRGDTLCILVVDGDWAEVRLQRRSSDARVLEGFASQGFLSEIRVTAETLTSAGCSPQR